MLGVNSPLKIKPPPIQWSPLASLGAAASLGSYLGSQYGISTHATFVALLLSVATLCAGFCVSKKEIKNLLLYASVVFVFIATSAHEKNAPPWSLVLRNELCELDCIVVSDPDTAQRTRGEMAEFDYRVPSTWFYAQAAPPNSVNTKPIQIGVQLRGRHQVRRGDKIRCFGWFHESATQNNQFTFYVLGTPTKHTQKSGAGLIVFKKILQRSLLSNLKKEERKLANALFFGVRGLGWETLSNKFRQAGMSHILAISGLHVGLIILIATFVFTKNKASPLLNIGTVFLIVLVIASVVELRAPIIRSIIMVLFVSCAKLAGSRCNNTGLLGFAAIVYLSCYPRGANTIAFQLTFLVVTSLCVLLPQIQWKLLGPIDHNGKIKKLTVRFVVSMWITGLCAWCIVSPITAHVFGSIAPSGLLSNVPAILMLTTTMFFGIAKSCGDLFCFSFLDKPLNMFFSNSLGGLLSLTTVFGNLPLAFVKNASLSWIQALCAIIWFSCWSLFVRKRFVIWAMLPVLIIFLCVKHGPNNTTIITTINVGHGTCHVIQHADHTLIIDSGSRNNLDVGSKIVIPKLRSLRVKQIDTIIITHADLDHLAGLIDIFRNYSVQKIVVAPQTTQNPTKSLQKVLFEASRQKIKMIPGVAGWTEEFGTLKLTILSPDKKTEYVGSNASSIVTTLQTAGRTVLFTGDIDEKRINQLGQQNLKNIDVVELPHHGQWSHESQVFINNLLPKVALQSTNRTRHAKDAWIIPDKTVRFVTAIDGDITTIIKEDGELCVFGSRDPDTMEPCVYIK